VVKLLENRSRRNLIAAKFFTSHVTPVSEGSPAFFREVDALAQLVHPCVVQIVGYCPAPRELPTQIGTEFAAGGSLGDVLPRLDDTEKAIVIVLGMRLIHSRRVIHQDLNPADILLDKRSHQKMGDLGSS
jgi:serine/threonine protein kinase